MEFIILTTFMFFVFIVIFILVQHYMVSHVSTLDDTAAENVMNKVLNEIRIAEAVSDHYFRQFRIQETINGKTYTIAIIPGVGNSSEIVIKYADASKERIYFLEYYISNESTIDQGCNSISKDNGIILLRTVAAINCTAQ